MFVPYMIIHVAKLYVARSYGEAECCCNVAADIADMADMTDMAAGDKAETEISF